MASVHSRPAGAPPAVLAATLGLAAAGWAAAVWLMDGMDMGIATRPGSFGFFTAVWVTMTAAMMLPGAAPAISRCARVNGTARAAVPFATSYLAVWAIAGVLAYLLDRPHGTVAAGAVVVAAGAYELTPLKRRFRERCREGGGSGLTFGLYCVGSGIGLMAMLVALDVMSVLWMAVVAVLGSGQKLLPAKALVDISLGLAIVGLGLGLVFSPALIPGLAPPAM
jgi:predicted metal-binding membrane protein